MKAPAGRNNSVASRSSPARTIVAAKTSRAGSPSVRRSQRANTPGTSRPARSNSPAPGRDMKRASSTGVRRGNMGRAGSPAISVRGPMRASSPGVTPRGFGSSSAARCPSPAPGTKPAGGKAKPPPRVAQLAHSRRGSACRTSSPAVKTGFGSSTAPRTAPTKRCAASTRQNLSSARADNLSHN